ncbi:signal peptidase [Chryseobacterium sp. GP-SGM7]|uniref:signal peptidase n=1 Tax=Chryseobacterium sp. GP-SGM7 TaxID=3411323 RepID=UPI003B9445CF
MKNKFILLIALFISHLSLFAQDNSAPIIVNNPPNPQVEGTGFGVAASPIDMYVYVLAGIAILSIVYFARKYKAQKI